MGNSISFLHNWRFYKRENLKIFTVGRSLIFFSGYLDKKLPFLVSLRPKTGLQKLANFGKYGAIFGVFGTGTVTIVSKIY